MTTDTKRSIVQAETNESYYILFDFFFIMILFLH